jgi:hypothetical protein
MRFRILVLVTAAACSQPAAPSVPPRNVAAAGAVVKIARDEPLGWLGLGLHRTRDNGSWIPAAAQFGAMTLTDDPLPPKVTVIGVSGPAQLLTVAASVALKYGCDENSLGVHPLSGPRLPPGPAWVLPPTAPPSWAPAAVAVRSTHADPTRHSYAAGALTFELTRRSDVRGRLQIFRDGRQLHDAPFERAEMDGADTAPIDLGEGGPGIPQPIAAWSFAPAGPFLVVMLHPGYEGVTLEPMLVEDSGTRVLEEMSMYLYSCAF